MHKVSVTYHRAGSTGPAHGRIDRTLPERWSELRPAQVWRCMDMIIRGCTRREILDYLLHLPGFITDLMEAGALYDLIQCIDWMQLDTTSATPIAPYIETHRRRFYLPTARLAYSTCREYMMLDSLFDQYRSEPSDELEIRIIALMVRPWSGQDGHYPDQRVSIIAEEETIGWRAEIEALPEAIRAYLMTLICAMRRSVFDAYGDYLFEQPPADPEETGVDPSELEDDTGINLGWMGAFLDVAADGVFGTFDQVLDAQFHDVAAHMCRKIDEARRRRIDDQHARIRAQS